MLQPTYGVSDDCKPACFSVYVIKEIAERHLPLTVSKGKLDKPFDEIGSVQISFLQLYSTAKTKKYCD